MQIVKLMTKHEWINNNNNYYKKKGQVLIPIYTAISIILQCITSNGAAVCLQIPELVVKSN